MATVECDSGQDKFSPKENGSSLEEKPVNVDYSEDLWLANSEDSSGNFAQQSSKVLNQPSSGILSSQVEITGCYPNLATHGDVTVVNLEFSEAQAVDAEGQVWSGIESGAVTVQSASSYMNGHVEQNGLEFNNGEEGKDFAQLVPAGSFVEGSAGADNQNKTFTSLLPAAAMNVGEELQAQYSTMIDTHQGHVVYYSLSEQVNVDTSDSKMQEASVSYDNSAQIVAANGEEAASRAGENEAVYISMDANHEMVARNFAVLSPAVINISEVPVAPDQTYPATQVPRSSYKNISTLPFSQRSTFTTQTSFASYNPGNTQAIVSNGASQQQHILQQAEYTSNHAVFSSDGTPLSTLATPLQASTEEYQDEDEDEDDDDEDQDEDMNIDENSVEFSELTCQFCNEAFSDQAALTDHMNNHPPLKTFVCETCGKGFATRRYLKYHRKNHCKRASSYEGRNEFDENDPNGELKRFSCNVCSRPFRVLKCMKVHKKKKHGILKEFTCQNCAVTFNSSQELIDHSCGLKNVPAAPRIIQYSPPPLAMPSQNKKKKKLKNAKPSCDICGKTFSDRISVDIHRVKHIEEELCPCDMCEEDDNPESSHYAVHFRIRFFTDDNQHILEDQKAAVSTHDPQKSDDSIIISPTPAHNQISATPPLGLATPLYYQLAHAHGTPGHGTTRLEYSSEANIHNLDSSAGSDVILDQPRFDQKCQDFLVAQEEDGSLVEGNYIVNESAEHSLRVSQEDLKAEEEEEEQSVYVDDVEDGEEVQDSAAVTVVAVKSGTGKVHICAICNKSFGDASKLELHYRSSHLEERPYQCDVCKKSFFTKWKLQRHMLSHLEQKPHSCPLCSKSFVERGKLEAHYRTHLGTKPYKCSQCPKAFTVKSQLSIHQRRIHSTDQPFACPVCGKAFLWKSGLEKHMRKHAREKPSICGVCGIKFTSKASLVTHMSKSHNQACLMKKAP